MDQFPISERWRQWRDETDLDEYESRWERLEATGNRVHGEADFVERYADRRILDAGCGMGRVGAELARRGFEVIGVDNDDEMLDRARAKEGTVDWRLGDLATIAFDKPFDTIVMAGNVLVYVDPPRRHLVIPNLSRALVDGGHFICGTSFIPTFDLSGYDEWCHHAGLKLIERYGGWDRAVYQEDQDYAVSVHLAQPGRDPGV